MPSVLKLFADFVLLNGTEMYFLRDTFACSVPTILITVLILIVLQMFTQSIHLLPFAFA